MFTSSNQKAQGAGGVTYNTDGVASMYANENGEAFLNDINPGNKVTGKVVFDVPLDAKIVQLALHDSAFSGGVKVAVA